MGRQSTRRNATYRKKHNIILPPSAPVTPKRSGKVNAPKRATCSGMMQRRRGKRA